MTVTTTDFEYLQRLVFERSAIVLADNKQYLLESRLLPVAKEFGLSSTCDVIERARMTRDRDIETRIIEAMTTNETSWFRDGHPFAALRATIVPDLIGARSASRSISIWSAASSSGQEIYSTAMLLDDAFPQLRAWRKELRGTDLNREVVDKAAQGCYTRLEVNRGLPAPMLVKYFDPDGAGFRVKPEIRNQVRFTQMNLAEPWPTLPRFDVIMMRNVLIYFDLDAKRRIIAAAARQLAPDGYLFLGAAETMMGISDQFRSDKADGATFYRLKDAQ